MQLDATTAAYLRERMVTEQIEARGIRDSVVLHAVRTVPRHLFVPEHLRSQAYADGPLPIGYGQTISQPFVVASMTEELRLTPDCKVLEVGTGCGYQAAVLAEICRSVYSIEIIPELYHESRKRLKKLHYHVNLRLGDGTLGWVDQAPFDAIIVAAAGRRPPQPLLDQLTDSGRLIIPIEDEYTGQQQLYLLTKNKETVERQYLYDVRFVELRSSGRVDTDTD